MARPTNGPWWYEARGGYYAWHEGRKVSLKTADLGEAVRAWHRLMAGLPDPNPAKVVWASPQLVETKLPV
jgi:hypothetical protein